MSQQPTVSCKKKKKKNKEFPQTKKKVKE